jgi:hypothetical protein
MVASQFDCRSIGSLRPGALGGPVRFQRRPTNLAYRAEMALLCSRATGGVSVAVDKNMTFLGWLLSLLGYG